MPIETLLLAVGGKSEHRIDEMVETALQETDDTDAEVVILHVFGHEEFRSLSEQLNFPAGTDPSHLAARQVTVSHVRERLEAAGMTVTVEGATGDRSDAIIGTADAAGADRIIVGGRKRTPVGKAIFGSTAQQVMLNASCPTTFVRA